MLQVLSKWWVVFLMLVSVAFGQTRLATLRPMKVESAPVAHLYAVPDAEEATLAGPGWAYEDFQCAEVGEVAQCWQMGEVGVCSDRALVAIPAVYEFLPGSPYPATVALAPAQPACFSSDEPSGQMVLTFSTPVDAVTARNVSGDARMICVWLGTGEEIAPTDQPAFCIGSGNRTPEQPFSAGMGVGCGDGCGIQRVSIVGDSLGGLVIQKWQ